MRKLNMGLDDGVGVGAGGSELLDCVRGGTKSSKSARADEAAASAAASMSKDEAQKVTEHNKLRTEIKKVKYPAAEGRHRLARQRPQGRRQEVVLGHAAGQDLRVG